ncbi:MAG: hypothetical protein Q8900_08585 [Bacillota bacterium]|nr:hypothetical protein [Bacillota bacterium]
MVVNFGNYLDEDIYDEWAANQKFPKIILPYGFHYCKEHGTIISWNGCILCN